MHETDHSAGYLLEYHQASLVEFAINAEKAIQSITTSDHNEASLQILAYRDALEQTHALAEADFAARLALSASEFESRILGGFKNTFNGVALLITEGELETIRSSPYIKSIYPNYVMTTHLRDSVPLIGADRAWELDADGNFCNLTGKACLTGKGITVGILDTGIDKEHENLKDQVTLEADFVPAHYIDRGVDIGDGDDVWPFDPSAQDDHGHGTHVAATAAGKGALPGVAPGAMLAAVKVLGPFGAGLTSWILQGIDWAVDPNENSNFEDRLDVINLSLGGPGDPDDPLSRAIDRATNVGVVAVVSAGNSGPRSGTIGSPGTSRNAITVAASNKSDEMAFFSSRGPVLWGGGALLKPDITAPGVSICAARWSQSPAPGDCNNDSKHRSLSGTSMAAPHVAGAAAILRQQHPDWTPVQVKNQLMLTSKFLNRGVFQEGFGRIDVKQALLLDPTTVPMEVLLDTSVRKGQAPLAISSACSSRGKGAMYYLEFGDGAAAVSVRELVRTHVYEKPGTYAVRCTAWDLGGAQKTKALEIQVHAPIAATKLPFDTLRAQGFNQSYLPALALARDNLYVASQMLDSSYTTFNLILSTSEDAGRTWQQGRRVSELGARVEQPLFFLDAVASGAEGERVDIISSGFGGDDAAFHGSPDKGISWLHRILSPIGRRTYDFKVLREGNVVVVLWRDIDQRVIYSLRSTDNGNTWPSDLLRTLYWSGKQVESLDAELRNSDLHVVFTTVESITPDSYGVYQLRYIRYSLSNNVVVVEQPLCDPFVGSADVGMHIVDSRIHAVFTDGTSFNNMNHVVGKDFGGSWSTCQRIDSEGQFIWPSISGFGSDMIIVAQDLSREGLLGGDIVYYDSTDAGENWNEQQALRLTGEISWYPSVVTDSRKHHVIWQETAQLRTDWDILYISLNFKGSTACGLIGIEPLLIVCLWRVGRRARRALRRQAPFFLQ